MTEELFPFVLLILGMILASTGYVFLLSRVFAQSQGWGHLTFFFPPAALCSVFLFWRKALAPFVIVLVGAAVTSSPFVLKHYFIDFGPREKMVEGELHLTLTGWDQKDYSLLEARPRAVVLQMANSDVTDETLTYLKGMTRLRELDLNNTQITGVGLQSLQGSKLEILRLRKTPITDESLKHLQAIPTIQQLDLSETRIGDAGLAHLCKLPNLKVLLLRETPITENGFQQHLAPMPSLERVSVDRTAVPSKVVRKWRNSRKKKQNP